NDGWLKLRASHNPSDSRNVFQNLSSTFSSNKGVAITNPFSATPGLSQLYGANMFFGSDISKFTAPGVSRQEVEVRDLVDNLQADWRHQFEVAGHQAYVQSGVSYRHKFFRTLNNTLGYDYAGAGGMNDFY